MKKRITLLFLSVALVFVLIPAVSVPVSAAPSSDTHSCRVRSRFCCSVKRQHCSADGRSGIVEVQSEH